MGRRTTVKKIEKSQAFLQSFIQFTPFQKSVLRLLQTGQTQGSISRTLRKSRAYISQTCSFFLDNNIIKKKFESKYNFLYEVAPDVLKEATPEQPTVKVTLDRAHNFREKYQILSQDKEVSTDPRSGYNKSWRPKPRDKFRHKFFYRGKAGEPNITIDVHPGTIVAYVDKGQKIPAEDPVQAEHKGWQFVHDAVRAFVSTQASFDVHIHISKTGTKISKPHHGYPMPRDHPAVRQVEEGKVQKWRADQSIDELNIHGVKEIETDVVEEAMKVQRAIDLPDLLPDMIRAALDPLHADLNAMAAAYTAGSTSQFKINEQNQMILKLMDRIFNLENQIKELKKTH